MLGALQSVDMPRLENWLDKMYPKILQILESNTTMKAFDSYEVLWEDEREDISETNTHPSRVKKVIHRFI